MPYSFNNKAHNGSGLSAIIYNSTGNKILGRGNGCQWQDNFTILPVNEWGKTRIEEFSPAKMEGSGSLQTFFIADINDAMPDFENFTTIGPCMMQIIIPEGRPNAGTIMEQFEEVWFTQIGGQFGDANSLASRNVTFVYGKRVSGAKVQGVSYPVE